MSDIVRIVEAGKLEHMISVAVYEAHGHHRDVKVFDHDVTIGGDEPTITYGSGIIQYDDEDTRDFIFEISVGRSQQHTVIYDELEVAIDFLEGDDA
jgi:hypothetical protein